MAYRINVARFEYHPDGTVKMCFGGTTPAAVHHFATELDDARDARRVLIDLLRAFPSDKFHVSLTRWETRGRDLIVEDFLDGEGV
jgi:hypothetical protein